MIIIQIADKHRFGVCLFYWFLEKNGCFNAETTPSGQNKKAFMPSF
ncbi:TPA: hypothetical protein TZC42_001804 [Streptococcus suis]|nr:hypothetical protein [Streptococcus suis]